MNIFEQASRQGIRFVTTKGNITTEDLWSLPLTGKIVNLDDIAKDLYKQIKDSEVESFVTKTSEANNTLRLKFNIVKHIITTRLAEQDAAVKAKVTKEKKQQLKNIVAIKENEALMNTSIDELKKMIDEL